MAMGKGSSVDAKILQVTDTHLFADKQSRLLGINTWDSYQAVIAAILQKNTDYDLVIVSGDIAQEKVIKTYENFANGFPKFKCPVAWLPGNHDQPLLMGKYLANTGFSNSKHWIFDRWQIILLNSHWSNRVSGFLNEKQMSFLKSKLEKHKNLYTMVVVHHHVLPVGSRWLDTSILFNRLDLIDCCEKNGQVKIVLSGHVHQDLLQNHNHIDYIASPSTSIQFKPKSDEFKLDTAGPGYREFVLYVNGTYDSEVSRVQGFTEDVDLNSTGY